MKNCKYVFKRGSLKGQCCKNEANGSDGDMCSKHAISRPKEEQDYKHKILNLKTTNENKAVIAKHYKNMTNVDRESTEFYKNQLFVDLALSYPFGESFSIHNRLQDTTAKELVQKMAAHLDSKVYGMNHVKAEIMNVICKFITNPAGGTRNNIALHGVAGVGKTRIAKVLSEVLGIPMKVIPLGGVKDSAFLQGHGYVYVESGPGKILQNVIDSKISNPILYFDELDKVSKSEYGKDIYAFMTYLTDPTQNEEFTDHYFYGMKFDLSKVFFVFSFNDIDSIDTVLLDRLNVISIPQPTVDDIVTIIQEYSLPEIKQNIGLKTHILLSKEQILRIINFCKDSIDTSKSSGIRTYYRFVEKLLMDVNTDIVLERIQTPIDWNSDMFDKFFQRVCSRIKAASDCDRTSHLMMYV
jgi:ATP-dependent Lon protease